MPINIKALTLAMAAVAAVQYALCAALVALAPEAFMSAVGLVLHADLAVLRRAITWSGFGVGIVAWTAFCVASGGAVGALYNRFVKV